MWKVISCVMTAVVQCRSSVGGSPIIAAFSTPPARGVSWAAAGPERMAARSTTEIASTRVIFMRR